MKVTSRALAADVLDELGQLSGSDVRSGFRSDTAEESISHLAEAPGVRGVEMLGNAKRGLWIAIVVSMAMAIGVIASASDSWAQSSDDEPHGTYVSQVAHCVSPGPDHGKLVSEMARTHENEAEKASEICESARENTEASESETAEAEDEGQESEHLKPDDDGHAKKKLEAPNRSGKTAKQHGRGKSHEERD